MSKDRWTRPRQSATPRNCTSRRSSPTPASSCDGPPAARSSNSGTVRPPPTRDEAGWTGTPGLRTLHSSPSTRQRGVEYPPQLDPAKLRCVPDTPPPTPGTSRNAVARRALLVLHTALWERPIDPAPPIPQSAPQAHPGGRVGSLQGASLGIVRAEDTLPVPPTPHPDRTRRAAGCPQWPWRPERTARPGRLLASAGPPSRARRRIV